MNNKYFEDNYSNWKSSLTEKEVIKLEKELNIAIRKYKYWLNKYIKSYIYETQQYYEYKYNQYEYIIERNCYLLDKNSDDLI